MAKKILFQLYSREGCHLCEQMLEELQGYLLQREATVEIIDIDSDVELHKLYAGRIPVLCFQEQVLCEYFLSIDKLNNVLSKIS